MTRDQVFAYPQVLDPARAENQALRRTEVIWVAVICVGSPVFDANVVVCYLACPRVAGRLVYCGG